MQDISNFREIFRKTTIPYLVLKPGKATFIVVDVNEAYLELTGTTRSCFNEGAPVETFFDRLKLKNCDRALLLESLRKAVSISKEVRCELLRSEFIDKETGEPEERYWSFESVPVVSRSGEVENILHSIKDMTSAVLIQNTIDDEDEERAKELQLYRHFIEKNPDGLYSLDREGNFTSSNEGLANLAEVPLKDLVGMNFLPFCAPEDEAMIVRHFHNAIEGKEEKFEAKFISAKGKDLILEISLVPIKVSDHIVGAYGIARDFTLVRQSQEVVVEKGKFLEANAGFISTLLEKEMDNMSLKQAFENVGKAMAVDRMYYFGADTSEETGEILISQKLEWTSAGVGAQIDNPQLQNMSSKRVEQIMGPLTGGSPFTAKLSELPQCELRELFVDQGIRSMLLLPIFLKNQLHGFIGLDDCTREREWSKDEITFLKSLTNNLTTTIERNTALDDVREQEEIRVRSEKKFKALVQEGADIMAILDREGRYSFVSDTSNSILGIPPGDFIGKKALDLIHEEERMLVKEQLGGPIKRRAKIGPFRIKNKEGHWRWLESTATNMRADPAVQGLVINSRDITKTLEQAREIEKINERFKLAATATQDLIYDRDFTSDSIIRFHSDLEDFLGHSPEKIQERDFWKKMVHPEELDEVKTKWQAALQDPEENLLVIQYRFKRTDGSFAHVIDRGCIIRDDKGVAVRLVGAVSDISEIKLRKEALKLANQRFKRAMKATNEMIWDWDIKRDIMHRSKTFTRIYGYKAREAFSVEDFWLPRVVWQDRERVKESLYIALGDPHQKKWKQEYSFLKADGGVAHVIDRGFIIRDSDGKATRMVGAVLDVSDSREMIKKITDQNRLLKEIAWEQSHVVRAPLARLQGLLELMEMEETHGMSRDEIWSHIRASANELDTVVKGIIQKTEEIEYGNR